MELTYIFLWPAMPNNWLICIMFFNASQIFSSPQNINTANIQITVTTTTKLSSQHLSKMNEIYRNHCSPYRFSNRNRSNQLYTDIKQIQLDWFAFGINWIKLIIIQRSRQIMCYIDSLNELHGCNWYSIVV